MAEQNTFNKPLVKESYKHEEIMKSLLLKEKFSEHLFWVLNFLQKDHKGLINY